ncbi:MAG: presqualene diphosphate synthase HpnD [Burkholderiaceae bacterium]
MTPDEYCQQKAAASGSSFYYSFLFLKGPARLAIMALYAFCREVDDVVDETRDAGVAARQLEWWRTEVDRMQAGQAQHPVMRALAPHMEPFELRTAWLHEIIDGMAMDLHQDRYLDFESLRLYCHRVAGVVGQCAARIFGSRGPQIDAYAETLGLAFQLTNIIRDVGEDARRGRIYLPVDELQRFGVAQHDVLAARTTPAFVELMRFQGQRARSQFEHAYRLLPESERRAQRPGLMMAAIYAHLLREIETDGYRVLEHRVALTPIRKLLLAWKTWLSPRPATP